MKLCAFIGIGFTVTFSIIFINLISMYLAKDDKQDEWFWIPLIQNTVLAIIATTYLIAHSIGLLS